MGPPMTQISGDNDTPLAFIPDIAAFEQTFDGRHYVPVPDDWMLAITDVVGSTARITAEADPKRGEQIYRDINFIAAAEQIEARLKRAEDHGEVVFGASRHDGARFTCQSNADFTQHVHFLDGTGKGFWAAARARSD